MATMSVDTSNMREAGAANTPYFDGLMGKCIGFSFTGITNGLIFNTGFGVQWVMFENTSGTPFGGSAQTVAAIHDGVDRVTFTVPAGGPFAGTLWVFYRQGTADARGSTGGSTITPGGVVEYCSRHAQNLRFSTWTTAAASAAQTLTTAMSGVKHMGTRALSTDSNAYDVRFSSDGNHGGGRVTFGASSGSRSGHTVFFSRGHKGMTNDVNPQ